MTPWEERTREEANLFNPAFCAVIIVHCMKSYFSEKKEPLPYALVFLILPIILSSGIRSRLPRSNRTLMHNWLQKNQDVLISFKHHAKGLIGLSREAILFALAHSIVKLNGDSLVLENEPSLKKIKSLLTQEVEECFKKATFLGTWIAQSGTPSTIYAAWGIRP